MTINSNGASTGEMGLQENEVSPAEFEHSLIIEPLGEEFEKILFDNLWELYESE